MGEIVSVRSDQAQEPNQRMKTNEEGRRNCRPHMPPVQNLAFAVTMKVRPRPVSIVVLWIVLEAGV